ncbi:MAG: ATP-dependent RNA helicase HrpA [Gammaproteobacteria bacterium]|nr:ATP-dependent RNA helicase HrpA [Gammaproteobacteria bacterium]
MTAPALPDAGVLDDCLLADRHRLGRRLRGLATLARRGEDVSAPLAELGAAIARSRSVVALRRERLPVPAFPPELPITAHAERLGALIAQHQVIVLCGETGSGKSTQLPKICLAQGRGVHGRIGHTQPRRIAARSLAGRIAAELGRALGTTVGYKVRFRDHVAPETSIKLMTDGILLAEIQRDRFLAEYDTLIVDEAHERSLNVDFLLGYLKLLLPKRPELRLVITSATIDPGRFARHFDDAPVVEVSGRTYPVEVRYRPPAEPGAAERDEAMQTAIVAAIDELSDVSRGDVLVFLSGEREIRETAETLRKHRLPLTEVLPLYARQGPAEQARIFQPSGQRRVVLATNVAETSLTVPGIRHVVDAGYARISRYSPRAKVQRLPVERVAKASAEQRKGRCGRVAEGVCIRLYDEEDYAARADYTEPEILRTNLAAVILQMQILGFGDVGRFPFLDPPDPRAVRDGYRLLEEIGAVDRERQVTRLGRQIARLPVDPRIGRMIYAAAHGRCLREVLVVAAALSVQDPRERPIERQQLADQAHALHRDEESDFVGFLRLWAFLEEGRAHLSRRKFRELCQAHFLSPSRVLEWHDVHQQLRGELHEMGLREEAAEATYEQLHRALLTGLLTQVGCREQGKTREFLAPRGLRFQVFPGSGLHGRPPKWVMAAELVETTKLYARTAARIEPEWVEAAAGHLVSRSWSEPHWEKGRGQVAAYEKVSLFGLTLVPRRKVNFGPIDPAQAREIFLRSALVDGDFETRAPFWRHNQDLIAYVHDLEAKSRRRDILVDEEALYAFYATRVPEDVYSTPQFEQWLRQASATQPKLLHLRLEDLLRQPLDADAAQFPDHLDLDGLALPFEYRFEPGDEADGVTLVVPVEILAQVSEGRASWLVPGLLHEKIVALIRGLPKGLRRHFVPVPDVATHCRRALRPADTPLVQALGAELSRRGGVHVPEDAWDEAALPDFLRMRFRVVDGEGATIEAGRDLAALKRRHAGAAGAAQRLPRAGIERAGLKDFTVDPLPETVEMRRGGVRLRGYPALVDHGDSVAVEVLDAADRALAAHRAGLRRLLALRLGRELRETKRGLPGLERMRLQYAKAPRPAAGGADRELADELVGLILDRTFLGDGPLPRDRDAFEACLAAGQERLSAVVQEVGALAAAILERYQAVRQALAGRIPPAWLPSARDAQAQLDRLVWRGFLLATPWERLVELPRYLGALAKRLEKLQFGVTRDQQRMGEMAAIDAQWRERAAQAERAGRADGRLDEIRWLLEELRVSLFAQELGTAHPVSVQRIERRWRELGL